MVNDPRQQTRSWLTSYWTAGNVLEDDAVTVASGIWCFSGADYPLTQVFFGTKNIDYVLVIHKPKTRPLKQHDMYIYGYEETVPIEIVTIDKTGITAELLIWQIEAELRLVAETYPFGSFRDLSRASESRQRFGSTTLYSTTYDLRYVRDKT